MARKAKNLWLEEMAEYSQMLIRDSKALIQETRALIYETKTIVAASRQKRHKIIGNCRLRWR